MEKLTRRMYSSGLDEQKCGIYASSTSMVSSKEAEYHEEQVDYVHVQIQSSKNIFFRRNGVSMITSHQQLRVDDQVN